MSGFKCRHGKLTDMDSAQTLYLEVASTLGGIARKPHEITDEYIRHWVDKSLEKGLWVVVQDQNRIIGSVHGYPPTPEVFQHVFSDLTIVVAPEFQSKGVGRLMMDFFLNEIKRNHPHILRVELLARESNKKAIQFYQSLGFKLEGRLEKRIKSVGAGYEADLVLAWCR